MDRTDDNSRDVSGDGALSEYREFSADELRNLVSAAREELHSWIANIPPEAHDGQPDEHRLFSDLCDAVETLSSANGHLEFNADVNSGTMARLSAENTALQQRVGELEKECGLDREWREHTARVANTNWNALQQTEQQLAEALNVIAKLEELLGNRRLDS